MTESSIVAKPNNIWQHPLARPVEKEKKSIKFWKVFMEIMTLYYCLILVPINTSF